MDLCDNLTTQKRMVTGKVVKIWLAPHLWFSYPHQQHSQGHLLLNSKQSCRQNATPTVLLKLQYWVQFYLQLFFPSIKKHCVHWTPLFQKSEKCDPGPDCGSARSLESEGKHGKDNLVGVCGFTGCVSGQNWQ